MRRVPQTRRPHPLLRRVCQNAHWPTHRMSAPRVARKRVRDERGGVNSQCERRCDTGGVRRDCVLWLKDGVLFPPPTGPAHPSRGWSPPSREDERVRRGASRRRYASPRVAASHGVRASESHREGFRVREGVHGGRDSRRDAVRHSRRAGVSRPLSDDVDAADAGPDEEDVGPAVVRFPRGRSSPAGARGRGRVGNILTVTALRSHRRDATR